MRVAGVPAHVTCLAPFAPPRLIDAEVLGTRGNMATAFGGFAVLFPDYPPFEGAFPDPPPHMNVGMDLDPRTQAELREQTDREVAPRLPFHAVVTSMSLLILDEHGSWREEA